MHESISPSPFRKPLEHVLLISTAFPFPRNCGKAQVLSGLCGFFLQSPEVKRFSYFHIASAPSPQAAEIDGAYYHGVGPSPAEALWNMASSLFRGRLPCLQEVLTYSRSASRKLRELIEREKPDLIICDTIRIGQYLDPRDRPPGKYYLYLDDLFSVRYERILDVIERFELSAVNPLGNFSTFVPKPLRFLANRKLTVKLLLNYEKTAVKAREIAIVDSFERCFLISPSEVSLLRGRSKRDNIHTLRLLSKPASTFTHIPFFLREKYFVFLGDLKLAHNHVSILDFIRRSSSKLSQVLPDYKVLIAGKGANEELAEACKATSNFELKGFVPDIQKFLGCSRGLLAPLLFGSGVKIKCIDALNQGVPIIATEFGVEGLGMNPGTDYLHADDVDGFIEQMVRLTNETEHDAFSHASRQWFESNYAPAVVHEEYKQYLLG